MSAGKRHNLQGQVVRLETIKSHLENEIERKKETINVMIDNEEKYCLEINRLNNIINELENILIKQIEEDKDTQNNKILFMRQEDKHILNTIKELKGSDK